ncbi:hypothetical protein [Sulfurospirillum sp. MES]|uniref:hypothetical protein n=1 Tax=Sulfurospirillum sp. MES TaxID=1565314 RepID=UPI0005424B67|nr:hypothetical protein [Sulfurospirillum sp. MES]KHG33023.1 MAG: hypothetical protein OA34_12180 [Sulfurospirillum sp. MES]
MIIWKGWGILAIVIAIVCSVAMQLLCDAVFGAGYYRSSRWAMPLALLLASGIIFFVGQKLNNKPGKVVIDKETNEEYILKSTHSLFWIPLRYWGIVTAVLAVWMYTVSP